MGPGAARSPRRALAGLVAALVLAGSAGCAAGPRPPSAGPPASPGAPGAALDRIARSGELRVCSTGDYRPFTYRDPATGRWSGIDLDMAADLARALHARLTVVPTTWSGLLGEVTGGRCDLAMGGVSVTPERAARAPFSRPYLTDGKAPITRCADAARFADLAAIDRPGVRVAVNPGGTNEEFARARLHQATVLPFPDNNTIFDQILAGRADLMITDASETRWQASRHPGALCAVDPDHPFTRSTKAYLLPPGDEAFRRRVDDWLGQALDDGTYRRAARPWLG